MGLLSQINEKIIACTEVVDRGLTSASLASAKMGKKAGQINEANKKWADKKMVELDITHAEVRDSIDKPKSSES